MPYPHKRPAAETEPHVKKVLHGRIETTDRQVDQLVFELHGLTDAEIKLVEVATS